MCLFLFLLNLCFFFSRVFSCVCFVFCAVAMTAVSFRVMGAPLIYVIIAVSLALFGTMCIETYSLGASEGRAKDFTEKMNLRGR